MCLDDLSLICSTPGATKFKDANRAKLKSGVSLVWAISLFFFYLAGNPHFHFPHTHRQPISYMLNFKCSTFKLKSCLF